MAKLRLDKILSSDGRFSRSTAEKMIRSGRVFVNGKPAKSGSEKYDTETDEILIDGEVLRYSEFFYIMMNKPAGVLSATEDRADKTALDLLPENFQKLKLFPAGRLDKDSEGLLIMTNDGAYAHKVITPNKNVFKKYYIRVEVTLEKSDIAAVESGIALSDFTTLPGKLEILSDSEAYVYIREGKYHQVKRMLGALGKPVTYLKRVSIGSLVLDGKLAPGEWREMTDEEAGSVFVG